MGLEPTRKDLSALENSIETEARVYEMQQVVDELKGETARIVAGAVIAGTAVGSRDQFRKQLKLLLPAGDTAHLAAPQSPDNTEQEPQRSFAADQIMICAWTCQA